MKSAVLSIIILLGIFAHGNSQSNNKATFPFRVQQAENRFIISAEVEEAPLYPIYANLFRKYKLSGNGQCWADLIQQVLEKKLPDLLQRIQLDPEAGAFFANIKTQEDKNAFLQIIVPIFSNTKMLETYIKQADKSRFDD